MDLDDEAFEDRVSSDYVGRFNESDSFKVFMTLVIVVCRTGCFAMLPPLPLPQINAILIAVETNEATV